MPPLVTALVDQYGWRVGYTFLEPQPSLCSFRWSICFCGSPRRHWRVRDGRQYVSRSQDEQVVIEEDHRVWTWQELLRSPAFGVSGSFLGRCVCLYCVMLHLFGHLLDLGLKTSEAAIILSITATFGALGKPLVGWLSDRFGARFTIWLGLVSRLSRCCFLPRRRLFGARHWRPVFMGLVTRGCPHYGRLRYQPASAANRTPLVRGSCAGSNCLLFWLRPLWRDSFMTPLVRTRWRS